MPQLQAVLASVTASKNDANATDQAQRPNPAGRKPGGSLAISPTVRVAAAASARRFKGQNNMALTRLHSLT